MGSMLGVVAQQVKRFKMHFLSGYGISKGSTVAALAQRGGAGRSAQSICLRQWRLICSTAQDSNSMAMIRLAARCCWNSDSAR